MSIQPQSLSQTPAGLQFHNVAECERWIASLPITNVQHAHQLMCEQIVALGSAEVPALERLRVLEALKETALFLQGEVAKRYIGKPLPLDKADADAWTSVIALWRALGANYQHCLQAYRDGDLPVSPHAALVTMRCLRMLAYEQFEHYHTYREPADAMWHAFHQLFAFSEEHGISRIRVQDAFAKHDPDSSCAEAYVLGLLANLANPYSLSVRQMAFLRRWLEKWSTLVGLSTQPLPPGPIPAVAVDFSSSSAAVLAEALTPQPSVRYLDLEQLSKTLRQTINLLKQGQTPGKLGLGEDARQPGCENLIMLLYVQWCRAGTLRSEERAAADEAINASFGIGDAHKLIAGPVTAAKPSSGFSSRDKWEMDNLGYMLSTSNLAVQVAADKSEKCRVLNRSASGFMCMVREPGSLMRMNHNQLLAVKHADGMRLGTVQWMKINDKNEFQCGVRLFPGAPKAITVRPSNFNLGSQQGFEQALLLPEIATPATPATLILPAGWFQNGRLVEIHGETKQTAKLLNLIERGADFDRGTIAIV